MKPRPPGLFPRSEEGFRSLVENSLEAISLIDRSGTVLYASAATERILGYPAASSLGRDAFRGVHPDDLEAVRSVFDRCLAEPGRTFLAAYRLRRRDGTWRQVEAAGVNRLNQPGLRAIVVNLRDITDRKRAEEALRASEERYRALFERNLAGVYRSKLDGRIVECNEAFARIFGFRSREELLGEETWRYWLAGEDGRASFERLQREGVLVNDEIRLRRRDNIPVWVLRNETLLPGGPEIPPTIEGTLLDITERKRTEELMEFQAYHDVLTGLPNRVLFRDRLTMAIAQSQRAGSPLAVMFLDLDRFKVINDSLGHPIGDRLLQAAADRLQLCVREHDTVARVGGDEFILLLPSLRHGQDTALVARKILQAVERPFQVQGHEILLTTSLGIAVYPDDGDTAETLIQNADRALYRAKEAGRNNYQRCAPAADRIVREGPSLEASLRRALERGEMALLYQPIVSLRTDEVTGAEALLRWQHSEQGPIPPERFLPLAEDIGVSLPLREWTLRQACAQARAWQDLEFPAGKVTVGLLPRQFRQNALAATVERILEETGLDPGRLVLEITESAAMQNVDLTLPLLERLVERGVGICIDGYGTGYTSLRYLSALPLQALKIDRAFIRGVGNDGRERAVVRAIIGLAHSLDLRAVGAGVETDEQRDVLGELACDEIQGPLVGEARSPEETAAMFRAAPRASSATGVAAAAGRDRKKRRG